MQRFDPTGSVQINLAFTGRVLIGIRPDGQRPIKLMHLRRSWSWLRGIGRDDQSAPDLLAGSRWLAPFPRLTRARGRSGCDQQGNPGESGEKGPAHRLLRGVVARQRFQPIHPEHSDAILFRLENRDGRIRTYIRIDAGI